MKDKIIFSILRVSLGVVFLVFGIGKFTGDYWARSMEAMSIVQAMPWSSQYSVWAFGVVEILTSVLLIFGFFVRFAAVLAALQLLLILIVLQFQEVRDVGLLGMAIFLAFYEKK
ncbi:MAG: DoxX family protein [Candidatus Omnitrophica bacterium]|nr:DoxX family protein [Candidatus Omnitrophota bacterium]